MAAGLRLGADTDKRAGPMNIFSVSTGVSPQYSGASEKLLKLRGGVILRGGKEKYLARVSVCAHILSSFVQFFFLSFLRGERAKTKALQFQHAFLLFLLFSFTSLTDSRRHLLISPTAGYSPPAWYLKRTKYIVREMKKLSSSPVTEYQN